jgi:mediator of RNA polymerase II transcription subunit 6
MTGIEYIVLHVQEPILYVIRKQQRMSQTQIIPLADYYILAGTVYQAPDLQSVLNSRLTTCVHHLSSAFDETISLMKYHPTKGYSWHFGKEAAASGTEAGKEKEKVRLDQGSCFQRRRVDMILSRIAEQTVKNSKFKSSA